MPSTKRERKKESDWLGYLILGIILFPFSLVGGYIAYLAFEKSIAVFQTMVIMIYIVVFVRVYIDRNPEKGNA